MPRKSKREAHSTAISYAFLRKRIIESDAFSGSSEASYGSGVNDPELFELCKSKCAIKYLSFLLYMTLRKFSVSWRHSDIFLKEIGAMAAESAHKWAEVFISGDLDEFDCENRGGKHSVEFNDFFPELEEAAKQYTLEKCSEKAASFAADDLAKFIDLKFYETTNLIKEPGSPLIRSLPACQLDLRRWGARFSKNSQRPYFEG
ncbi:unnamed protein product, partial [Rotaria magnacalcarata]